MLDAIQLLKIGPSAMMILFGIAQLIQPQSWEMYIPTVIVQYTGSWFLVVHALINICLGILLWSEWKPKLITAAVVVWYISIIPFAFLVDKSGALRDIVIVMSLIAYFQLL